MEDEEWEDVIVVSFVPLPITSEENVNHGKFKAIERDLTVQTFELKETPPLSRSSQVVSVRTASATQLAIIFGINPTEPWIYDRTAQYKHTKKVAPVDGATPAMLQMPDPSGRYVILAHHSRNPITLYPSGCKFTQLDLREGITTDLCEVEESPVYESWLHDAQIRCLQVSDRYAYFVRGQDLCRLDWRKTESYQAIAEPGKFPTEWATNVRCQQYSIDISIIGPDTVYFSYWKHSESQPRSFDVRVLKFSESKSRFIHSVACVISPGCSADPIFSLKVIKEGLVVKFTAPTEKKFHSVTRLYSLSDLRLRATSKSQATSMYPTAIEKLTMIRMKGIPVFLDFLDKEGTKNLANFIFLYGNRFHTTTFRSIMQTSGVQGIRGVHSLQVGGNGGEIVVEILYGQRFGGRSRKTFVLQIKL